MIQLSELRGKVIEDQPERAAHILGCEETAAHLAERWGESEEKARRAALLHDVTKSWSYDRQLKYVEKYGIITGKEFCAYPSLIHSVTGAHTAGTEYGEGEDICSAILYHTTGRAGMSKLEKIIYLADYIEPNRSFGGLDEVRGMSMEDLNTAVLLAAGQCIRYIIIKNRFLHPATVECYNWMLEQTGNERQRN